MEVHETLNWVPILVEGFRKPIGQVFIQRDDQRNQGLSKFRCIVIRLRQYIEQNLKIGQV